MLWGCLLSIIFLHGVFFLFLILTSISDSSFSMQPSKMNYSLFLLCGYLNHILSRQLL